jgi:hypothetical protein
MHCPKRYSCHMCTIFCTPKLQAQAAQHGTPRSCKARVTRCAHQVRQTKLLLGFHRDFHAAFVHGQRVDVEFSFSKRVYKLMLQAPIRPPPRPPRCHRCHRPPPPQIGAQVRRLRPGAALGRSYLRPALLGRASCQQAGPPIPRLPPRRQSPAVCILSAFDEIGPGASFPCRMCPARRIPPAPTARREGGKGRRRRQISAQ